MEWSYLVNGKSSRRSALGLLVRFHGVRESGECVMVFVPLNCVGVEGGSCVGFESLRFGKC